MRIVIALLIALLLTVAILSFSMGCKKEEDTKNGVVGTVSVQDGESDGVNVMLFEDPSNSFDATTVWYTTARQPSVGFPYDPKAAFDWRKEDGANGLIVASTTSNADGAFNIAGQPDGVYILVAEKPGYGWTAPMRVNLNVERLDVGSLILYPDSSIFGITSGNLTLRANRHYVIPDFELLRVSEGDTLYVEPGAVIRGGDGAEIRVYGSMICNGEPDHWVTFTSNLNNSLSQDDWEGVSFQNLGSPGIGRFSYASFEHCADAIISSEASVEVDHCYFGKIFLQALDFSSGKHVIARSVFNTVLNSIRSISADSVRIENNIVYSSRQVGIWLTNADAGSIHCNWFHNCGRFDSTGGITGVIFLEHDNHLEITNNHFQESWYAFHMQSWVDTSVHISYNTFDRINRVLHFSATPGSAHWSAPTFQFNCMTAIDNWNIFVQSCFANSETIHAENCFWGENETSGQIDGSRIHDNDEDPECPEVIFQPYFIESCPPEVGICAF